MGFFSSKPSGLDLDRRTDTTISVSVPPKIQDFTSITPLAHTLTVKDIVEQLGTSSGDGLSKNEAARRLESCGENLLEGGDTVSAWKVFIKQLGASFLTAILLESVY
jgi:magnesium-transporting ATPase (P-type)